MINLTNEEIHFYMVMNACWGFNTDICTFFLLFCSLLTSLLRETSTFVCQCFEISLKWSQSSCHLLHCTVFSYEKSFLWSLRTFSPVCWLFLSKRCHTSVCLPEICNDYRITWLLELKLLFWVILWQYFCRFCIIRESCSSKSNAPNLLRSCINKWQNITPHDEQNTTWMRDRQEKQHGKAQA